MAFEHFIIGALVLVILTLAYACRRLYYLANNEGMRDFAFSMERANRDQGKMIYDLMRAVAQVGELFDHAGVDMERGSHTQESVDLKFIGGILRRMVMEDQLLDQAETQVVMAKLGDRYGIEPYSGGPYTLDRIIRIAEEIIERVLPSGQPA